MRTHEIYNLQTALEHFERGYVRNILVLARGNETRAAHMLGIPPHTLRKKLEQYGLREGELSQPPRETPLY